MTKRTLLKRAKTIFKVINNSKTPFPKSRLKKEGFSTKDAENWLNLIEYIQNETLIRLIKTGNTVIVEKIQSELDPETKSELKQFKENLVISSQEDPTIVPDPSYKNWEKKNEKSN